MLILLVLDANGHPAELCGRRFRSKIANRAKLDRLVRAWHEAVVHALRDIRAGVEIDVAVVPVADDVSAARPEGKAIDETELALARLRVHQIKATAAL